MVPLIKKFRAMAKPLIIIICVAFVGGALYLGGASFFGRGNQSVTYAAIATVNGQPINEYDFMNVYYQQIEYYQSMLGQLNRQMLETIRYSAYDRLVDNMLIIQEIEARNIEVPKDEIEAELADFKEAYSQEVLDQYGYTDDYIKESIAVQLKYNKLISEISGTIDVSEQAVKDMYEQARASHILVKVDSDDEQAWDEAKERAESVLAELEHTDFAELAKMYSDDSSAENGGDIGFIKRGQTVAPFEEAVFNMEVGEVSDLVKSEYGYHIIMVTDVKRAEGEEYELAKEQLREELETEQRYKQFANWLTEQKEQAEIVIIDPKLIAFNHVVNGELEEAIAAYRDAVEEEPDNGYLYASMGNVYSELGQLDNAVESYEQAVEKQANDGELFFILAALYQEQEQIDQAVEAYLKASELMPYDFYAQYTIYVTLTDLGAEEEAEVVNQRIAEIEKMYAEAQEAQEAQDEQETAEEADDSLIEVESGSENDTNDTNESDMETEDASVEAVEEETE